jgi:hypothetical protein
MKSSALAAFVNMFSKGNITALLHPEFSGIANRNSIEDYRNAYNAGQGGGADINLALAF